MRALYARTAAILNDTPDGVLPLAMLRERLRQESLYDGGADTLLAVLRRRPDLFTTVQPAMPLADEAGWSDEERRAYRTAFASAGMAADARVSLREAPPATRAPSRCAASPDDPLQIVESAVLALWADGAGRGEVHAELSSALLEIDRMRARLTGAAPRPEPRSSRTSRTTTPPPGPRRRS